MSSVVLMKKVSVETWEYNLTSVDSIENERWKVKKIRLKKNSTCDFSREKREMKGSGDGGRCTVKSFYLSIFF